MDKGMKDKLEDIYERLWSLTEEMKCGDVDSCEECKHYDYCGLIVDARNDLYLAIYRLIG